MDALPLPSQAVPAPIGRTEYCYALHRNILLQCSFSPIDYLYVCDDNGYSLAQMEQPDERFAHQHTYQRRWDC